MPAQDTSDPIEAIAEVSLSGWDWVIAAAILVGAIFGSRILKAVLVRAVGGGSADAYGAVIIARFAAYTVVAVGAVYALSYLGVNLAPILGALGVVGIALAFALQDTLSNLVAGVIMLVRRPFRPGDQIETGDVAGTVVDVTLRATLVRTFDGTNVYVPNKDVLSNPITNLTEEGLRRTTLGVGLAYDADLDHSQRLLERTVAAVDGVASDPAPQAYVHEFGGSSINFAVRFWHDPEVADEWRVRDAVARIVKRTLDERGIDIPFPQRTLRFASQEAPLVVDGNGRG